MTDGIPIYHESTSNGQPPPANDPLIARSIRRNAARAAGKGDRPRPYSVAAYKKNFERIFRKLR
jgi:hypothetical protein